MKYLFFLDRLSTRITVWCSAGDYLSRKGQIEVLTSIYNFRYNSNWHGTEARSTRSVPANHEMSPKSCLSRMIKAIWVFLLDVEVDILASKYAVNFLLRTALATISFPSLVFLVFLKTAVA